jgi:tripartite-type tricarboxylate transporter receptor subunit TctC
MTMMISRRRLLNASVAAAAGSAGAWAQAAASYPSKPVTLIVPFAAGGATDAAARVFAKGLSEDLKQPVIVDNRPGGMGTIAIDHVSQAASDGYTLLYVGGGSLSQTFFSRKLNTELLRDLTPVIQLARGEFFLNIRGDLPVRNAQEFLTMVRKQPGKYNYASIAATQMMPMEMLLQQANAHMTHIAYKNPGQVQQAFAAGDIVATVSSDVGYEVFLQSGKMRRLMVFGDERHPNAPDVPSAAESGFRGLRAPFSFAIWAPVSTAAEVVSQLNVSLNRVLKRPDALDFIKRQGGIATGGSAQVHVDYVKAEHAYWSEAARVSKFVPE